jgi:hypothetical protein
MLRTDFPNDCSSKESFAAQVFLSFSSVYVSQFFCHHGMARPQIANEGDGLQKNWAG